MANSKQNSGVSKSSLRRVSPQHAPRDGTEFLATFHLAGESRHSPEKEICWFSQVLGTFVTRVNQNEMSEVELHRWDATSIPRDHPVVTKLAELASERAEKSEERRQKRLQEVPRKPLTELEKDMLCRVADSPDGVMNVPTGNWNYRDHLPRLEFNSIVKRSLVERGLVTRRGRGVYAVTPYGREVASALQNFRSMRDDEIARKRIEHEAGEKRRREERERDLSYARYCQRQYAALDSRLARWPLLDYSKTPAAGSEWLVTGLGLEAGVKLKKVMFLGENRFVCDGEIVRVFTVVGSQGDLQAITAPKFLRCYTDEAKAPAEVYLRQIEQTVRSHASS